MSTCKLCGCPIEGGVPRYCIGCYGKCCERCPTCMNDDGKLKIAYRKKSWGQKTCETCNNERSLFTRKRRRKATAS
jgi:hypothetical protein